MPNLIFTADDFGCLEEIDAGILYGIDTGVINSVAVIPNGNNLKNSMERLVERAIQGKVEIGCHFSITAGKALTYNNVTQINPGIRHFTHKGYFRDFVDQKRKGTLKKSAIEVTQRALFKELYAQFQHLTSIIDTYKKDSDVRILHLSSHHDALIYFPEYHRALIDIANYFNCYLRSPHLVPPDKANKFYLQLILRSTFNMDFIDQGVINNFRKNRHEWLNNWKPKIQKYDILEYQVDGTFVEGVVEITKEELPKMPLHTNGIHYGPIPPRHLEKEYTYKSTAKKRQRVPVNLDALFKTESEMHVRKLRKEIAKYTDNDIVEFPFHLIFFDKNKLTELDTFIRDKKNQIANNRSPEYYPGLNVAYFDSRLVELLSVDILKNIDLNLCKWNKLN